MDSFNKKRLLIVILIMFSFIISVSIILIEELQFRQGVEEITIQNAVNKTKERERYLHEFIDRSKQNILAIRKSTEFNNYLQNNRKKNRLKAILMAYAKEHPGIMQIRFIDQKGDEKIRIERKSPHKKPFVVANDKLQSKLNRYYFINSKHKKLEKVWFSAIDLNGEGKTIKYPYQPTFRAILPIKKDGKFGGILVINYFMADTLKKLTLTNLYKMILFDDKGYIIYDTMDKNKSWGNSLAHKYNISSEFPQNYIKILTSPFVKTDFFISKKINLPIYGGVNFILKIKESYLAQRKSAALARYLSVSFIVFLLSIILIYIVIKIYSRTLLDLDKAVELNDSLNEASKVAKIGFWEFDYSTQKIKLSDSIFDILETPKSDSDVTFETLLLFVNEEDREKLKLEFSNSIKEKRDYFIVHNIITGENKVKIVEERGRHYFDKNGNLEQTIGSVYDVSEKYYSEQKFLSLLENAADGIHILDKNGNLIYFSKSFASNLGYSVDETRKLTVYDWDNKFPKNQIQDAIKDLLESPKTFETKHLKKDGTVIDVQINAKGVEIEGETYLYASQRDITLQNKYKEELEKTKDELIATNEKLQKSLNSLQLTTSLYENEKLKYKRILDLASDGIFLMDTDGKLIEYSKRVTDLLGYSPSEMENLTVYDWDKSIEKEQFKQIVKSLFFKRLEFERVHTRKDGSTYVAYITANLQLIENKPYIYASVRDITKQKENEFEVLNSKNELETIFNTALEGIALIDLDNKYIKVNKKYCDMLGYSEKEILQRHFFEISDERDVKKSKEIFNLVAEKGYYENFERFCITKKGEKRRFRSSIALMPNKKEFLVTAIDNTELYDAFKHIEQQSYIDELTQLHNRKAYNEKIEELLELYKRHDRTFALMIFDIDHFKSINDSYGHDIGDKVLVELSNIVKSIIRKNDYFFRLGGEEFVVLVSNTNLSKAKILAEKIRTTVEKKVDTVKDGTITVSIGLTEVQKYDTIDTIFKRADEFLYHSKESGRNQVTAMFST